MITLKDLNNIDIKDLQNIDWGAAKDRLQSRPELLINILLTIVTVFVLSSTFKKFIHKSKISKNEQVLLQEKLNAFDKLSAIQKKYRDFRNNVPEVIGDDQLIETLSKFASRHNVQIVSFSPAKKKSNKLISLTSVEVNIASEDYESIILFVNAIESSPYSMRIQKWSGSSVSQVGDSRSRSQRFSRQNTGDEPEKKYIQATIQIESVELINA